MGKIALLVLTLALNSWAQLGNQDPFGNGNGQKPKPGEGIPGNAGNGGVELSEIPVALSSKCDSVILKGTKRFENVAFLMPKGRIAKDDYGKYLIEVVPVKSGQFYNLRLNISFAEAIRDPLSENSIATKIVGCDYEELKFKVNNYLASSNQKVDILATVPVSNISFSFDLNGKVFSDQLGSSETNNLNYLKEANILEFKLTRDEVDEFLELVNGRLGLNLDLDIHFTAKREIGRVYVEVNNQALANDVEAKIGGKKKILAAELGAIISTSLNATNANIIVEGGDTNTQLVEISQRIVMGVLAQSGFSSGYGDGGWLPGNGGGWNDPLTGGLGGGAGGPDTIDRWRSRRNSGVFDKNPSSQPGNSFPGGGDLPDDGKGPVTSGGLIDAKAFLGMLRDKKNMTFNYVMLGGAEIFSYRTSSNLTLNIDDLLLKTTSFSTSEPRRLPWFLKKDESFTFSMARKMKNTFRYIERKNYFSKSDIMNNDRLKDIFSILSGLDMTKLKDVNELNEQRAVYEKVERKWVKNNSSIFTTPVDIKTKVSWGSYTYEINRKKVQDAYFELTSKQEALSLPLSFSFSRLGSRRFSMKKLFTPNDYWEVKYNDFAGTITFKAKKELGIMTVFNQGSSPIEDEILSAGVFEDFRENDVRTFKKEKLFEDAFPKSEEIFEITASRFWGEAQLESEMQMIRSLF